MCEASDGIDFVAASFAQGAVDEKLVRGALSPTATASGASPGEQHVAGIVCVHAISGTCDGMGIAAAFLARGAADVKPVRDACGLRGHTIAFDS